MIKFNHITCLSLAAIISCGAAAVDIEPPKLEEVLIIGSKEDKAKLAGSGVQIGQELIEKQSYTDLNQLISMAPGVYVREEDGYGLRPNIGIRGATAERSQKITIMEDGVLIAPAPYSAPAAYYITNAARLYALEVLKGPASIQFGPHTVGGAVNLVTRPASWQNFAELNYTVGTDRFQRMSATSEFVTGNISFMLDAMHYSSDGFKQLASGGDTGFERNDFNAKIHWQPETELNQIVVIKVGYADEDSNETYLGLTDTDFDRDPTLRYPSSELDRFVSDHSQLHFSHKIEFKNNLQLTTKVYFNEFNRSWNKFDGFIGGPNAKLVLNSPSQYVSAYKVLAGSQDSAEAGLTIDVTDNDRAYSSDGIQFDLSKEFSFAGIDHKFDVGVRYHHDDVERDHQQRSYLMTAKQLVSDGITRPSKVVNYAETDAIAVYLQDELSKGDLTLSLGLRYEDIQGSVDNFLTGSVSSNKQSILAPGAGVHYQLSENIGLLAGVYVGFSPAGPGASQAEAEESLNFEYGVRYEADSYSVELIGFLSDYDNLLGRCRASDANCAVGDEFNGGQVEIGGIEFNGQYEIELTEAMSLNSQLNFTYTESAFQKSFLSQFSQWELVKKGDELPYVPKYVGRWQMGVESNNWAVDLAVKYQHEMREVPGVGDLIPGKQTESIATLDLSATWFVNNDFNVKLLIRNATDESAIVSHRPYGARPNLPRMVLAELKYRFNN
ncbi:MAG: TonB-dependent receptor [Porticoccaceae bacterium]|jgi:Fe(3+) dicitrate transport protein|nr:TonB-dependent receptor [Porticoccaceae bacterium]MDG1308238.1 TonB-dependent receptor [Porticoccaceae bacterium]